MQKLTKTEKEEILIKGLKNSVKNLAPCDDPFWDAELFNREICAYSVVNGDKPRIDPNAKWRFRLVLESSLLWWESKHLDILEFEKQKRRIFGWHQEAKA